MGRNVLRRLLQHLERLRVGPRHVTEPGPPARVDPPGTDDAPGSTGRSDRLVPDPPAQLGDPPVRLDVVAATAGRYDVVPRVGAAAALRDDVVEAGGGCAAVDAAAAVPGED